MAAFIKRFVLLSLLALLAGCQTAPKQLDDFAQNVNVLPPLWVAEKHNQTLYIFGSIHVLPPGMRWYSSILKQAFESSEALFVEVKDDIKTEIGFARLIEEYGYLPVGKTLQDYLSDQEMQLVNDALEDYEIMDKNKALRLRPWAFELMMSSRYYDLAGIERSQVTRAFSDGAHSANKPVLGLEEVEQSYQSELNQPLQKEIVDFKARLARLEQEKPSMQEIETQQVHKLLMLSWAMGDEAAMEKFFVRVMPSAVYRSLITKRNRHWMKTLRAELSQPKRNTIFMVAGVGHFLGKDSLLKLLKRQGWTVTRAQ